MTIKTPPGPALGMKIVGRAVNDLMPERVAASAAAGVAPQVGQPIPRYLVKLNDLTDVNFLAKAVQIGWRYLIVGAGPAAIADVKQAQSGEPSFDSLIHGDFADRMAQATDLAAQQYEAHPDEFEARILEIPSIYMSALWLHGPRDVFFSMPEGQSGKQPPLQEDSSFVLRAVRAAAAKRNAATQKVDKMPNPEETGLQGAMGDLIKAALNLNETARQLGQMKRDAPSSGAVAAGGPGATAIQLTPDQRLICERVINAFETGSMQGDYSDITIFDDGPNGIRQITYGRSQTTEYGNLRELVDMYAQANGQFSSQLQPYVDRIGRVALVDDATFKDILHRAGAQDQVMRNTQDIFFDRRYFQPAMQWAGANGFTRALSALVIYDSYIQSGQILDLLRSRFPEAVPARGGNEQSWIQQYVSVRNDWLQSSAKQVVRSSAYRTRDLLREIGRNNWDLALLPISAHGVPVDTRPIAATMATTPGGGQPAGVPYIPQPAVSILPAGSDSDPAAPLAGEADDLSAGRDLANYGEPIAGGAATPPPLLALDMGRVRAFLQACMNSTPRVTYGLGKKVPSLSSVPGRDFTQVDCSGFVRQALRLGTTPPVAFPDGSVVQHDWVDAQSFAKSTPAAALQSDGFVRIAFLDALARMFSASSSRDEATLVSISRDIGQLLIDVVHGAPVTSAYFSQIAAAMVQADQARFAGRNNAELTGAFLEHGILSVGSTFRIASEPLPTAIVLPQGAASAVGPMGDSVIYSYADRSSDNAHLLGLGQTPELPVHALDVVEGLSFHVHAPDEQARFAVASFSRDMDGAVTHEASMRNFVEGLIQRQQLNLGDETKSITGAGKKKASRTTHSLQLEDGKTVLKRICFACCGRASTRAFGGPASYRC
jgi:chitosanase